MSDDGDNNEEDRSLSGRFAATVAPDGIIAHSEEYTPVPRGTQSDTGRRRTSRETDAEAFIDAIAGKLARQIPPSAPPPKPPDPNRWMKIAFALFGVAVTLFGIVYAAGRLTGSNVDRDALEHNTERIIQKHNVDHKEHETRIRKIETNDAVQTQILQRIDKKLDKAIDR
jgi:hypothetical protein